MTISIETETWHSTHLADDAVPPPEQAFKVWRANATAEADIPEQISRAVFSGILPMSEARAAYERGLYGQATYEPKF